MTVILCKHCGKRHETRTERTRFCSSRCARLAHAGTPEQRFWKYANATIKPGLLCSDTCWIWTGGIGSNGYGQLSVNRKTVPAHRFGFELVTGITVPKDMILMHSCDNPRCVNPKHLSIGTNKDNTNDARRKFRLSHGERHHRAKLTADDVRSIRSSTERYIDIARQFGVHLSTIGFIKSYRTWQHVE